MRKYCIICGAKHKGHGLCEKHLVRFRKYGNPFTARKYGGLTFDTNGYLQRWLGHKYIYEHRYMMEQFLGRKLTDNEIIHHKDGNITNNNIENLEVTTRAEHRTIHHPPKKCSIEDCTTNAMIKGFCRKHYDKQKNHKN